MPKNIEVPQKDFIEVIRTQKISQVLLGHFKNLLIAQLACNLNVPSGVALKICRRLHFELRTGLKQREDCSFQVLNAYDLYFEFEWLLIV